ncbi:hypothetical protein ACTFIW_001290 [Dictyostelium discoideum]
MKRFLYLLVFFVLLFSNNDVLVSSQLTPDTSGGSISLSIVDKNPIYNLYPKISSLDLCYINYNILVEEELKTNIIDLVQFSPNISPIKLVLNNSYKSLYSFTIDRVIPGNYNFSLMASSGSSSSNFTLSFKCNSITSLLSTMSISFLKEPFYSSFYFFSFLKVEGVGDHVFDHLEFLDFFENSILMPACGSNTFLMLWDSYYISKAKYSNWAISFNFASHNITIETKSYYNDGKNEIYKNITDFSYYPDNAFSNNSIPFQEFGQYRSLVMISLNTETAKDLIQLNLDVNHFYTHFIPIKGGKGDLKYLAFVPMGVAFNGKYNFSLVSLKETIRYSCKIGDFKIPKFENFNMTINKLINNNQPILEVEFSVSNPNLNIFPHAKYTSGYKQLILDFPFGYVLGPNVNFKNSVVLFRINNTLNNEISLKSTSHDILYESISINNITDYNSKPPKLISYKIIKVSSETVLYILKIYSINGLDKILVSGVFSFGIDCLIEGDIYLGTYEFAMSPLYDSVIQLYDTLNNIQIIKKDDFISLEPLTQFSNTQDMNFNFDLNSFNNITFLINDLNLINNTVSNIMYLNSTDIPRDLPMVLGLSDPVSLNREITYPFYYNSTSDLFYCKFIIPKNNIFGEIDFNILTQSGRGYFNTFLNIISSGFLPNSLRVNQTYLDNQGPIFEKIERIGVNQIFSNVNGLGDKSRLIGWNFFIKDDYNGFESGFIKVIGSVDNSIYSFNFTSEDFSSGDKWSGSYQMLINVSYPCISQSFIITHVLLKDTNNIESEFKLYSEFEPNSIKNPFLNFYNQSLVDTIYLDFVCSPNPTDISVQVLDSFSCSKTSVDVLGVDRIVEFTFKVSLAPGGIKKDQLPIVYMVSSKMEKVMCISNLTFINDTIASYSCSTEIPLGYGYPDPILLSLYGFIGNNGFYNGFSTSDLMNHNSYYINTTISFGNPIIKSTGLFYSDSDRLVIIGREFESTSLVFIDYNDDSTSTGFYKYNDVIDTIESSIIILKNVKPTEKSFFIKVQNPNGKISNIYKVIPIYFNIHPSVKPTETPSITVKPTETPSINPPQLCIGNPICGGSNQGYCVENVGCICYPPYVGVSCQSKVIIINPPIINPNNPSTNLTFNDDGDDDDTDKSSLIGLISIISLRELGINNEIKKTHFFENWIQTSLSNNKHHYIANIKGTSTNITIETEWFDSLTNITFANQKLTMNPSTLKYNINITKYEFISNINSLQLVIQSKLSKTSNIDHSICSAQSFGETTSNDNSNYIQLSVEKHSLYGRFIKRGIVDNKIISINNEQLNDLNSENSYYTSESYIGINIPWFRDLVQLDPDFSVLLDGSSANSICKDEGHSLSKNALIGIIVGCVGGALVIIIVSFIVVKYRTEMKIMKIKLIKLNKY